MKKLSFLFILILGLQTGCNGFGMLHPFQHRPWTLMSEGDQYGGDQLQNRHKVANASMGLDGWTENQVLDALGQPQTIRIVDKGVSEDWHFIYYKTNDRNITGQGSFVVHIQDGFVSHLNIYS